MQKSCFITLEGVDGAGKSTHFDWLIKELYSKGIDFIHSREPGGTFLGEKIRDLVLHEQMTLTTETLLMFAARAEHWLQKILPALEQNKWVICDRFMDSSYAYQGGGRQLGIDKITALDNWLNFSRQPDFTFLFDVPLEIAKQRLSTNRAGHDRFEQEDQDFFNRTRQAYLARYEQDKDRFKLIQAQQSIDQIRIDLSNSLEKLLAEYA